MRTGGSVRLANVSLTLPGARTILHPISLSLAPGSVTALLGRSGSGKTTLLRIINLLARPTSGSVVVDDVDLLTLTEAELHALRRRIGYVIQETGLFPHLTIHRNVALPLEIAGVDPQPRAARADAMLELVGLDPRTYGARYLHQLSGGQRQRAGLARALVTEPSLLLLDEPFGALDPLTRLEMQHLLCDLLARFATTAVLVTHDLREATHLAQQLIFLDAGREVASIPTSNIATSSHPFVMQYREASA